MSKPRPHGTYVTHKFKSCYVTSKLGKQITLIYINYTYIPLMYA